MKAIKRTLLIVLAALTTLALVATAYAQDGSIPPGPPWTLTPDYIGQPAQARPLPNAGAPQDPNLAPNPFAHGHSDIWMSDTADIAGPLGRNPIVKSTTLPHENSWVTSCGSMGFDSHGRPVINCYGIDEASIVLLDPDTLQVVSFYPLKTTQGMGGEGDQKFPLSLWSIYGYVDNRDQVHIVSESKKILTLREAGSPPVLEPVDDGYDLSQLVEQTNDRVAGVIMDFQGRYWINMGNSANIYVLNPKTAKYPYLDLPRIKLADGEATRNGMALTREGAAYIVTTQKMYRVDAGADDQPHKVWEEKYETSGQVRPGQYELGSGTTPTILGEGKYVAVTDNPAQPEQLHVVVYRTDERLHPGENRVVCQVPVFEGYGGFGAGSNSLVGFHNSIIAQNTYNYLFEWKDAGGQVTGTLQRPGYPGIERIDINPNGQGCAKVWANTEVHSNALFKLSTRTGLVYTQDRKYDAAHDVYAVYWAALDFRTGQVVWEKLAGTFGKSSPARFDNFWAPIGIGPNGALYGSVYGGITMIKDGS